MIPRLARRGQNNDSFNDDKSESKSDDEGLDSTESSSSATSFGRSKPPAVPPRSRKTGWGDELRSAKQKTLGSSNLDQYSKNSRKEDDIPVIPDLDELIDDNIADIAKVPLVGANRVTAYKELDTDLVKSHRFASMDGVSLSLLMEKIYPEDAVKEPDEIWSWESLFTQVTTEINNENQSKSE